jgi:hypothetical protein
MIRKTAVGAVLALLAGLGLASGASAYTIVDLEKVALIQGGLVAPVTIPCGGERIDLRGTLAVHLLIRADGTLDYHVNAMDASGVGAVTGTKYRLVGAAGGEARLGETLNADLTLEARSGKQLPVEVGVRATASGSRALPALSLASIRIVQPCDPGTITLSEAQTGGFRDYTIRLVGTALDPSSSVAIFGVTARGSLPYTVQLATLPVEADGTVATYLYPRCSFGFAYYYATGTSASGQLVTSNTFIPPC